MKALILCAGYGKRMFPITLTTPKPLLPVNGRPLVQNIYENLISSGIKQITIISNATHYQDYVELLKQAPPDASIEVISNGVDLPDNALGAIADMALAVNHMGYDDDILVIAGDSHLAFSLRGFIDDYREHHVCSVIVQEVADPEYLKRLGVAELDGHGRIVGFEEKPQCPRSNLAAYAAYIFTKEALHCIDEYLEHGNPKDALGKIIGWLKDKTVVNGYVADGAFIDIGTIDTYKRL